MNTSLLQRVCTCRQGTWTVVCSWYSTCDGLIVFVTTSVPRGTVSSAFPHTCHNE